MSQEFSQSHQGKHNERGSIMVMTAIFMVGLVLAVGLCIDVARIFLLRAELQNAADAAALAAARELNSGVTGIKDAVTRATSIVNTRNFNDAAVTVANVEFAINLDGTYMSQGAALGVAENIRFVRVTTQPASVNILFAAGARNASGDLIFSDGLHNEARTATAGMSVGINNICDFFPIAVALTNPNPAPGTLMSLKFTQGTGNSATLANFDYVILEVPDINGNRAPETAVLSAGLTDICKSIGADINFNMTPSANPNNGPKQIKDGVNTRFNVYVNGYGNALNPTSFPPDSNVSETINYTEYKNGSRVTAPNPNAPGMDARRLLLVPIIAPGTYDPPRTVLIKFGLFYLRQRLTTTNPCSQAANACAQMEVEYIGDDVTLGRGYYDPTGPSSSFTVPVLYK